MGFLLYSQLGAADGEGLAKQCAVSYHVTLVRWQRVFLGYQNLPRIVKLNISQLENPAILDTDSEATTIWTAPAGLDLIDR
jgi:hypothetical protein